MELKNWEKWVLLLAINFIAAALTFAAADELSFGKWNYKVVGLCFFAITQPNFLAGTGLGLFKVPIARFFWCAGLAHLLCAIIFFVI